jgi:4-amino-4-deoxy-L-arabinose transferase-like glycosyltransferase
MKKAEPYWPLIILLAFLKFLLPLLLQHPVYELQRDEYLYYQQGQHFDLGYLENPPLLSWLGSISSLLGGSESWIKFWPCLFGAATIVVACLITASLGGKIFAQFLTGICILTGAFMRVNFLFQPNSLDIFFWTLSVYFIIRYINDNKSKNLYWFCISLAMGWWSKYSIIFIAAAIILSLVFSKHRKVFAEKKFYLAAITGIIIIVPNIWWQNNHNWPVIHHMKELQETQLQYLNPVGFLMEQIMMLFPAILVWIGGITWLLKQPNWRFLAFTYFFVIILLMLGSGKGYYALGAYPVLFAAGGVAWEQWIHKRMWKRYALSGFILLFTLLFIPLLLPVWKPEKLAKFYKAIGIAKSGVLKWEDGKDHSLPQDFADMLGWKELTEKTEKFFQTLPDSTKKNTIVFGRHYGHAGGIKYYSKNSQLQNKIFTDVGSFLLWIPDDLHFKNIALLTKRMPGKDDEVFNFFEKVTVIDSVTNPYSRQFGDKIIFFENIDTTGFQLAAEGLKQMKNKYNR